MENLDKIYAESVAKEYSPKNDSKVVALRKLDNKVKLPATIFTYTLGIVSALVLGVGMCLAMDVIGPKSIVSLVVGIVIGLVGIAGICVNYPIYKVILKKAKAKYASDIIALAKDITD
jgi:F0F1-type ATP synthase assembly protein I